MNNPFISVIIPNYCHAQYLDQRIQSVLNQTYDNFEIIILDDCSPDDGASRAVIEKYRDNPHVSHIVYNEQNSGSTFIQWNRGLNLAKGEYCWIAESDDYCESNMLETLVDQVKKHDNVVIAYCIPQYVDVDGNIIRPMNETGEVFVWKGDSFIRRSMSHSTAIWNASSALFKRECAIGIDKSYMDFVAAGDRLFWSLVAKQGNVVHVKKRLSWFRQHGNEVSPGKKRKGITSKEDYRILEYMEDHKWISCYDSMMARHIYLEDVEKTTFDTPQIKSELLNLWTYGEKVPACVIHALGNLFLFCIHKLVAIKRCLKRIVSK